MVCIYCGHSTSVSNSRHQKRANSVWRRRQCQTCKSIFTTVEQVDTTRSLLVHQTVALEPFERDKLFLSIHDSLKHRKSALTDATGLTATVVSQIYGLIDSGVIERDAIVELSYTALERFDASAASHYSAFHRG